MVETGERSTRREIVKTLAQLGAAGMVGTLVVSTGMGFMLAAFFMGPAAVYGFALAYFALFVAGLAVVANVAPEASWLTGSRGGRVWWGLVVGGVGLGFWALGWGISDEAGLGISRSETVWMPATFGLFALVAGTLLRRWYLALGSLAVLVAVGLSLLGELAGSLPSDVDRRLAESQVERGSLMVADVPGYRPVPHQKSWQLVSGETAENAPSPYLSLSALPDEPAGDCVWDQHNSKYVLSESCELDRPGLFYLPGGVHHVYVHRVDGKRMVLKGPITLARAVLRQGVLSARPAEPAGALTADVPGYRVQTASAEEAVFDPIDKSGFTKSISVYSRFSSTPGQCGYGALACEVESPELRYERYEGNHVYLRGMGGDREVTVQGPEWVPREALRTAAQNVRPPTEDELRLMLPEARPSKPDRTPMAVMRRLARDLYGTR